MQVCNDTVEMQKYMCTITHLRSYIYITLTSHLHYIYTAFALHLQFMYITFILISNYITSTLHLYSIHVHHFSLISIYITYAWHRGWLTVQWLESLESSGRMRCHRSLPTCSYWMQLAIWDLLVWTCGAPKIIIVIIFFPFKYTFKLGLFIWEWLLSQLNSSETAAAWVAYSKPDTSNPHVGSICNCHQILARTTSVTHVPLLNCWWRHGVIPLGYPHGTCTKLSSIGD